MMDEASYSVRVKNGSGWRNYPTVRLMISVGQQYHEGNKLHAVVDWINRNKNISHVHVSVNDLLQRHNFVAIGESTERASNIALAAGSLWLTRNESILSEIDTEVSYSRWEEWLYAPEHSAAYESLIALMQKDSDFATAVEADSHLLLNRRRSRGESIPDEEIFVYNSRAYILEELAVFAQETRLIPAAEVYPGSNLSTAQYLIGKDLAEPIAPLSKRYFTRIDFAKLHSSIALNPATDRTQHKDAA